MNKFLFVVFSCLLPFSVSAYFTSEETEKQLVSDWYYEEVPVDKFLDYFQKRGYNFLKNELPCEYSQIIYTQEANKYGGTAYFSQCNQGFFHKAIIHIYRNLPQEAVDESLKDVRHLFTQVTREKIKTENFIQKCIDAPADYEDVHGEQYYTFECRISNYDYVFKLTFNREHPHPSIKVKQIPQCMDKSDYARMIKTRLFERAKFARRLDEYYLLYPEDEPEEHKAEREEKIKVYNDVSREKEFKKYYWNNNTGVRHYRKKRRKE